jgi:hypothetical protein
MMLKLLISLLESYRKIITFENEVFLNYLSVFSTYFTENILHQNQEKLSVNA